MEEPHCYVCATYRKLSGWMSQSPFSFPPAHLPYSYHYFYSVRGEEFFGFMKKLSNKKACPIGLAIRERWGGGREYEDQ